MIFLLKLAGALLIGSGFFAGGMYFASIQAKKTRIIGDILLMLSVTETQLRYACLPVSDLLRILCETKKLSSLGFLSRCKEKTDEGEKCLLAEGTWSIDVVFENVVTEELELIKEPIPAQVAYGWDLQGNDVYQDTVITSFILRPMSASIICDLEHAAPDFLTVGDRCVYVVMKDGSKDAFHGDSAGSGIQNLQTDSVIDLGQVVSVVMPDGTKLTVPHS